MSRIRMWSLTSALLGFALFAAACGDSSDKSKSASTTTTLSSEARALKTVLAAKPVEATRFVGKVEGTDAFIGIQKRGDAVKAYVCDSKNVAVWMTGTASGDTLSASNGPVSMTGTVGSGGKQVTGSVTMPDGSKHAFTADLATTPAGLFESYAVEGGQLTRAGWVVLASGEQRGAAKTGTIVRPVSQVSQSTYTALLGKLPAPISPPPGPVTNKASLCKNLQDMYNGVVAMGYEDAAAGKDTKDIYITLQEIGRFMQDEGCNMDGLHDFAA